MGDPVKADRERSQTHESSPPESAPGVTLPASHSAARGPVDRRVDLPHGAGASSRTGEAGASAGGSAPTAADRADQALAADSALTVQGEELLLQASQIAQHLRGQLKELDRREHSFNEQLAALDQERRNFALRTRDFEDEMADRQQKLQGRETELSQKIATCEKLLGDLEKQKGELEAARGELDRERARLRDELGREVEADRAKLREDQQAFDEDRRRYAEQIESHRVEHEAALRDVQKQLEREREKQRAELAAELNEQRAAFHRERDQWNSRRETELAEIERERQINETALQRAEQELDERRRTEVQELENLKNEHDHRLREERQAFEQQIEQQRTQLKQERGVLENRIRFQQDHLQKLRDELEADQDSFRREQQQARVEIERRATLSGLRGVQLDHYRALLEERETSLARQQQLLARSRQTLDNEIEADKQRLRRERETWDQERQAQRAELRRQQDMLSLHAENLENRRTRLDQLRAELEETHRQTLETRMAIEEAWAQFAQSSGQRVATERVDQARESLSDHYRQLRGALAEERKELLEKQSLLEKQKDDFRAERQKLTEWAAQRDEKLRGWQEQLRREAESLHERDAAWRSVRDGWMQEKVEAEQIIRDLLDQLAELNDSEAPGGQATDADDRT